MQIRDHKIKIVNFADNSTIFLRFVSVVFYQIFYFFHQIIALQKLWKMFFISSTKFFLFSRYLIFCNFSPSFPQMEVEEFLIS